MSKVTRLVLGVFATYRLASLSSSEEGPYLPFLYKDPKQMGIFKWIRMKAGAFSYGPDGLPETALGRGIACSLCTGVYISALLLLLIFYPSKIGDWFLAWMGISGAQVLLENLTSDEALQSAIEDVADSLEE